MYLNGIKHSLVTKLNPLTLNFFLVSPSVVHSSVSGFVSGQ